jgi:MiaB-like tRNA modifying enzyme
MKFFIKTYGCSFNQADSENIEFFLKTNGHEPVKNENEADVVIFNTCGVKDSTESRIVNEIKKCKKKMIVTGCLAQVQPKKILSLSPNLSIAGTFNNTKILDCFTGEGVWVGKGLNSTPNPKINGVVSTIQISTGCLGNCTFCQTKFARGGLKSFSEAGIVENVEKVVGKGCKEVRLTSQDLGCYGFDSGSSLPSLLEKIIEIEGDFRVRLGMMNPEHAIGIKESLSKLLKNEKIYSFIHIPVQSGSDSVLEKMERGYTVKDFRNVVNFLKANSSDLTVETDFIVGFPTEAEEDFNFSIELMKEIRFDIVNLSKFSARKKTKASFMKQLNKNEIKRRSVEASKVYKRISLEKNLEMIGRTEKVIVTEKAKCDSLARTNSYKPVLVKGNVGEEFTVKITSAGQSHLRGVFI